MNREFKFPNWNPRRASPLSVAYNEALKRARLLGIETHKDGRSVSDVLVDYIVERANKGIFDPEVLATGAIVFLQSR